MPNRCCVYQCSEPIGFIFPKDQNIRKLWLDAVRRDKWAPTVHSIVCPKHFLSTDYLDGPTACGGLTRIRRRLKPNAVPSVFSWGQPLSEEVTDRGKRVKGRKVLKEHVEKREQEHHEVHVNGCDDLGNYSGVEVEVSVHEADTPKIDVASSNEVMQLLNGKPVLNQRPKRIRKPRLFGEEYETGQKEHFKNGRSRQRKPDPVFSAEDETLALRLKKQAGVNTIVEYGCGRAKQNKYKGDDDDCLWPTVDHMYCISHLLDQDARKEATTGTRTTLAECVTEDEGGGEEKREEKTDDDALIDFQTTLLYCAKLTEFATKNIPALAEKLRSVQADIQAVFSQREETARDEVKDAPSIKVGSQQRGETCCARGCDAGRCHGVGSLFPFPAKKARCTQWLRSVGREDLLEKSAKQLHREGYKVCSSHFKPHFLLSAGRRVRLAHNAVPTLNKSERRRPQKKKSVAEKRGPKQKRNRSRGQTKGRPEAAVLPEVKVEVDWAMDPALHWNKMDHNSLCSDGTDPAEEVEDPSSLFGPVPMNTCEMGASSSSSSTQAGSVGYVKSEPVEEGMEERFLSGSGGGDPQMESACCTRTTGHVMTDSVVGEVKSWNCAHVNCEHMNCDHGNCEHMNCDHGNCEHMNCGHGNSEHMNCGHGNSEHRSSSDAVTGGEPLDSREQVSGGDRQTSTTDVIDDWDMSYIVVKAEPQSDSDTEVDKT